MLVLEEGGVFIAVTHGVGEKIARRLLRIALNRLVTGYGIHGRVKNVPDIAVEKERSAYFVELMDSECILKRGNERRRRGKQSCDRYMTSYISVYNEKRGEFF